MPTPYRFRFLGLTDRLEAWLHHYFVSEMGQGVERGKVQSFVSAFRLVVLIAILFLSIDLGGHYYELPLGTYGDFFGGLVNPFLTCASLIALALTIVMQSLQLKDARAESSKTALALRKQAFDASFFNMLELHNRIVQDLTFEPSGLVGSWNSEKRFDYAAKRDVAESGAITGRLVFDKLLDFLDSVRNVPGGSILAYRLLQTHHNDVLGHYFRNLYQILKFIDKTAAELGPDFDADFYSNIVRAQLSTKELRVLLYNCSDNMVDAGAFRRLVKKYRFLEHLPFRWDKWSRSLRSADHNNGEEALYEQYLSYEVFHGTGRKTGGAFGRNPVVAKHLAHLEAAANQRYKEVFGSGTVQAGADGDS